MKKALFSLLLILSLSLSTTLSYAVPVIAEDAPEAPAPEEPATPEPAPEPVEDPTPEEEPQEEETPQNEPVENSDETDEETPTDESQPVKPTEPPQEEETGSEDTETTSSTDTGVEESSEENGEEETGNTSTTDTGVEETEQTSSTDTGVEETDESASSTESSSDEDEEESAGGSAAPVQPQPLAGENTVMLHIRFNDTLAFEGAVSIPENDVDITDSNGFVKSVSSSQVLAILYAADQNEDSFDITDLTYFDGFGSYFLNCISITELSENACGSWQYVVNGYHPGVGMDYYSVTSGDDIYLFFGPPLRARTDKTSYFTDTDILGIAEKYNFLDNTWIPATEVTLSIVQDNPDNPWSPNVIESLSPNESGEAVFTLSTTGTYKMGIAEDYYTNVETFVVEELDPSAVMLHVRVGADILFEGAVVPNTSANTLIPDSTGTEHSVSSTTVLALLYSTGLSQDSFDVTKLTYFDSFGAFLLNCIDSPLLSEEACDNWHYAVNGVEPFTGMDSYKTTAGEDIYVFFGNTNQIVIDSEIEQNTNFSAKAETYDFTTNSWLTRENVTIAITQEDPHNPWTPIVITSSLVDALGVSTFNLFATGTYSAAIEEDYYFPLFPFTIVEEVEEANDTSPQGGPGPGPSAPQLDLVDQATIDAAIDSIIEFAKSEQGSDGAIVDGSTTDWIMMAFGSEGIYAYTIKEGNTSLMDAAQGYLLDDAIELNSCASYPRHALGLIAGGTEKTTNLITGLITKIETGCTNGTTYGLPGINDDIFALIALLATGASSDHPTVKITVDTILADQTSSGAFTWNGFPGADVTGAAINALKYAKKKGVSIDNSVFTNAKQYLKDEQLEDGGWGYETSDPLTTSWAMMGINALGENQSKWAYNDTGKNPWHVMTEQLDPGGYYTSPWAPGPDWFATKHAIQALNGSTWPVLVTPKGPQAQDPTIIEKTLCDSCETTDTTTTTPTTTPIDSLDSEPTTTTTISDEIVVEESITETNTEESSSSSESSVVEKTETVLPKASTLAPVALQPKQVQAAAEEPETIEEITEEEPIQETKPVETIEPETFARKAAKTVFGSAAAGSVSLALMLAWRFGRALV